ncbi:DUF362 domain-containing protein, partial [candidate division KSB1 bacterium]|nr:DUF362 domain-containing protein [candidate division KSB1 bacterium]
MLNKIKKFKYNAFLIAIIATAWFLFRVITKPSRAFYPCQRIALSQVAFYWGSVFVPFIFPFYQQVMKIVNNNYQKVIKIVVAFIVGVIVFQTYQSYHESNLKEKGSRTIQKTFSASMLANTYTNSDRFDNKSTKQTQSPSLVSFYYDPLVYYGLIPPYDKQQNPAYNLVWKTVSELSLGDTLNPLRELINDGDTVLIKPNLISDNGAAYTHPAVVRPLIDMAVLSGAYKVYVGDGGPGYTSTEEIITNTNYRDMVNLLQDIYPENEIEVVNLNDRTNWHWINLGGNSAFAGSGYSDYDLGASFGETLFNHGYYSSSDPQGINPGGEVAGWYAVNDVVLNSDVIINVPKMKNHWTMMVTLCLKNQVGSTLCSTYDNGTSNWSRIPHCKTGTRFDGNIYYFNNDIFWRSILDVNKILIYVDKNGILNTEKQRKYLNVLDGIIANEKNAGGDNPYNSHFLLAGIDPVAIDAVACRLMGYDFDAIPGIKNVTNESTYPIGINDPKKIVVVG